MEGVDGSATSALLTGLTPNVDYEANITASNCAGTSEPTAFSFRILGTREFMHSRKCLFFTANFSAPLIAENILLSFQCGHGPELAVLWKACQEIMRSG